MSDLAERLKAAVIVAIDDLAPALTDPKMLRYVTVEIEVRNNGQVVGGRAWIERGVSLTTLM